VGDIVRVKAGRNEYHGFKAKVLTVLTGDVKVEMLDGPTVGTKQRYAKFKFLQLTKVADEEPKAEPENKESKKPKKSSGFQDLNEWLADATQDVT
jgi:sRNA-binding protein